MKPAYALSALLLAAPVAAYDVAAPEEIVTQAQRVAELARDVVVLGTACYEARLVAASDQAVCTRMMSAANAMDAALAPVRVWLLEQHAAGATDMTNMPDIGTAVETASATLMRVVRASQY